MKTFMENLMENFAAFPDRIALRSSVASQGITYGQVNEYSGRIYAYLKQKDIGREDMVLICLPRGVRAIISMIGVWKAGAAFTVVEDTYAPDRIEFIRKDCACKLVIDVDVWEDMIRCAALDGFEKTNPHDAAFAVYTSGTTGNPKGVLHEYGKLGQAVLSAKYCTAEMPEGSILALLSPLNFVASLLLVIRGLAFGNCIFVLPYDVVKNPVKFSEFLLNEKVAETFMPPSFVKIYKNVSPYLRNVYVGGEPCNGLFIEGPRMINKYASSEAGMTLASFIIDKAYEKTPAGKCGAGLEILILDENGSRLPDGEIGEICFFNEFTRGYINLPEKTKEVFIDGIYHMGDLGYINENGDLMVCGRKDDMIKINGNRIEPAEIECAIKENLDIKNIVVKGFNEEDRSFICTYLIADELKEKGLLKDNAFVYSSEEMKKRLEKRLPYYMIPTYYVVMDKFPLNPNGKIAKKALEAPNTDDFTDDYEAPETETETYLCELFAKVLKRKRVGVNDDFYLIGGDSLSSMILMSECKLYGFSVNELYRLRTPKKLGAFYDENVWGKNEDIDEKNRKALKHAQILSPKMLGMLKVQEFDPSSTVWNLPLLAKMDDDITAERLAAAVDKVLKHHPSLNTVVFRDEDSVLKQKYVPEMYENVRIETVSATELKARAVELVKPFSVMGGLPVHKTVFQTEDGVYLYLEIYHTVVDGTSIGLLLQQIIDCARDPETPLPEDYYYLLTRELEKYMSSNDYRDTAAHYEDCYRKLTAGNSYVLLPVPDHESDSLPGAWARRELQIDKTFNGNAAIAAFGGNAFFMAVYALTCAKESGMKNAFIQWISNSRDSAEKMNAVGLFIRSVPLFSIPDYDGTLAKYLQNIKDQIAFGIAHNSVPFVSDAKDGRYESVFLYQKDMFNIDRINGIAQTFPVERENNGADSMFEFSIYDEQDAKRFVTEVEYSSCHYEEATVEHFLAIFEEIAQKLLRVADPESVTLNDIL